MTAMCFEPVHGIFYTIHDEGLLTRIVVPVFVNGFYGFNIKQGHHIKWSKMGMPARQMPELDLYVMEKHT